MDQKLVDQLDCSKLPAHVAIIMDGNGRWAQASCLPRIDGHRAGVSSVDEVVTHCRELGIKALTLFCFSTENWQRPPVEINALMELLVEYIKKQLARMQQEGIRFNVIGRVNDLPQTVYETIQMALENTKENNTMALTLALSYSSRLEIVDAAKRIGREVKEGGLAPEDIDEVLFQRYLYTAELPELDLLIRTSGETRLSNFLLWQMAYAELYFTQVAWPDFGGDDLLYALLEYQKRERRFGLTSQQLSSFSG